MTLPSKKIILMLTIGVASIGLAYVAITASKKETYIAPTVQATTTESALLAKDSDSDGLKDWEEELWKTDPLNSDTDADGATDGQEIKQGRDPLIAGPNDKLDTDTVANKVNNELEKDLTETDKFSRELFMKIVAAGQSPTPPTEADFQNFLNSAIANEVNAQKTKTYEASDFQVDTEETPEKIKNYGNAIATILKKPPVQKLEYEIDIVNRAETNQDPSELKKLDGNIAAYEKLKKDLLALSVPQSALSVHTALVNSVAAMAWSITGLKYILTDPLKALPGVAGYADNAQNFSIATEMLKNYFGNGNITFEPKDDGYRFFDEL